MKNKIKVNKLTKNPLFVNFLNWQGDKYSVEKMFNTLLLNFKESENKKIVLKQLTNINDKYLQNLSNFQKIFKKYILQTIHSQCISKDFVAWMDNAFKYIEERISIYAKNESRSISIKNAEGCWFEGIIIYNFILTFNYFGVNIIKLCPVCSNFFSHKGKYAKYCNDTCKTLGMVKK